MKVYAISDLHLSIHSPKPMDIFGGAWENYVEEIVSDWREKVAADDAVVIPGDISWAMTLDAARPDLEFLGGLPGKKILLRGNHDYWWKSIGALRAVLPYGVYAVQNDCVRIGRVLFCGSRGWTTPEGKAQSDDDKKIYDREIVRTSLSLEDMRSKRRPEDFVVALSHYPPFNSRFDETPFTGLYDKYRPNAVVYGHLHGNVSRACLKRERGGVLYYLTSCDLVGNKLVEIL